MKKLLVITYLVMLFGTGAELYLLEHFEGIWQMLPIILMGLGLLLFCWVYFSGSAMSKVVFRIAMVLFLASGLIGTWLHFDGNMEFELEMYPTMEIGTLIWESLKGATPTLAPGTMIAMGLVGWMYTLVKDEVI